METNGSDRLTAPILALEFPKAASIKITSHDSGIETGNDSNESAVTQIDNNTSNMALESSTTNYNPKYYHISKSSAMQPLCRMPEDNDGTNDKSQCQIEEIDQPGSSLSSDVTDLSFGKKRTLSSNIDMGLPVFFSQQIKWECPASPFEERQALNSYMSPRVWIHRKPRRKMTEWESRLKNRDNMWTLPAERRMRLAAATNNFEMMKRLLNNGVSPNSSDALGRTPLHIASGRGYTEIVSLLLKHGANATCRDSLGNTPLHLAAVTSKISVVTLLLEAGTDPLSADNHGYNPLQLAESKLRILQSCKGEDMLRIKAEVSDVVNMLLACLKNRQGFSQQVEALSNVCSRLTLSNTTGQVQDEVRDLLSNIDSLTLKS